MAAPTAATGIAGWYKADSITGKSNGSAITTWPESSGVASAGSPTNSPTYSTGQTTAGLGVVHFVGTSSQTVSLTGTNTGTEPRSVYLVFRVSNALSGLFGGGTAQDGGLGVRVQAGPQICVTREDFSDFCTTGNTVSANVWHRFGFTFSGTAWTVNLDGTVTSGSVTETLSSKPALLGLCNSYYLSGDIAEVIVYSTAHSTTDRDGIIAYLDRWNTAPAILPEPVIKLQAVNRSYTY